MEGGFPTVSKQAQSQFTNAAISLGIPWVYVLQPTKAPLEAALHFFLL